MAQSSRERNGGSTAGATLGQDLKTLIQYFIFHFFVFSFVFFGGWGNGFGLCFDCLCFVWRGRNESGVKECGWSVLAKVMRLRRHEHRILRPNLTAYIELSLIANTGILGRFVNTRVIVTTICIYIYRERERDRERDICIYIYINIQMNIYTYIYILIYLYLLFGSLAGTTVYSWIS